MIDDRTGDAEPVDLIVVGGGIAGLVVALDAARAGLGVTVLEAGPVVGGMLRRGELDGIAVDLGAESFATRTTGVADLIADADLDLRVVDPAPGGAHLAAPAMSAAGRSDSTGDTTILRAPLPQRTVLGIPADPTAADVVRILGADGAARAAAEPAMRGETAVPEPSLAELVSQRCGPLLVERLVDPLCRSVYSVPATRARLSRLHPALWREFRSRGSLVEAAQAVAAPGRAGAGVAGIAGGMWRLAAAVHAAAAAHGAHVRTGAAVRSVSAHRHGVRVELDDTVLHARQVVVATGSAAAARLFGAPSIAPPVRVVAALVDSPGLDAHPVGSGVIVAAGVPTAAKALTHANAKWPWLAEQLRGTDQASRSDQADRSDGARTGSRHIVRLSARDVEAPGLDSAADIAREITALTGVALDAADVRATASAVWTDAVAASPVDSDRQERLAEDGIVLAGAAAAGTGLASVIPHARALARDLIARSSAPSLRRNP